MIVKADRVKLGAKVGWTSSSHPLPVKFVGSPTIMFRGTALPHKKNKGSLHRGIVQPRREIKYGSDIPSSRVVPDPSARI